MMSGPGKTGRSSSRRRGPSDDKNILVIVLLIWAVALGAFLLKKVYHHGTTHTLAIVTPQQQLTSIELQNITVFRMYPRANQPSAPSLSIHRSDKMVTDFLHALKDMTAYVPNHDTAISRNHQWFMEIGINDELVQIKCYIPSSQPHIVVVQLGEWSERQRVHYGSFQSKLLFQWFQHYHDIWLHPSSPM